MFADRTEAGVALGRRLLHLKDKSPAVFALPRGGVPVAFEVAAALGAPLDIVLVRKIGAPHNPELAIGAVVDGPQPQVILNESIVAALDVSPSYIEDTKDRELAEIARRKALYLGGRPRVDAKGKTAIVIDDGIATGATMKAALAAMRGQAPARLVLAVPVASPDTITELRSQVDEIVCLEEPEWMGAIGMFYGDFRQVSDDEVIDLLQRATRTLPVMARWPAGAGPASR